MAAQEDKNRVLKKLSPIERKALPFIAKAGTIDELCRLSGLDNVSAMRALQFLSNKGLVKIREDRARVVYAGENGRVYVEKGLPEDRFLKALETPKPLEKVQKEAGLTREEANASIGVLRSKGMISIEKGKGLVFSLTDAGRNQLKKKSLESVFLSKLPMNEKEIEGPDLYAYEKLRKRKGVLEIKEEKTVLIEPTELGRRLSRAKLSGRAAERLTPEMLRAGKWKGKEFREYDIVAPVPKLLGGKRQFYSAFIERIKEKLARMGFREMTGPIIELEFYNFDALFQPQNHPARAWSDTYRIKEPKKGSLPKKEIVEAVREAHENGGGTGSTGWRYRWDPEVARRLMPRSHDTAISPRYMAQGIEIPGKYFSLVRCFRPDVIDASHGVEFNQMGGIIVDRNLNFRHLLWLLREFVFEITGATEVRFLPDYFPFTEPSVQVSAKTKGSGWMEVAGAGIFRPELSQPLGIKEPVLAWGFGIDRLAMLTLGISDIRDLFSHDLSLLRTQKRVVKIADN